MVTTASILQHSRLLFIVFHTGGFKANQNIYAFLKNQKNPTNSP